ncbi:MAG: hypothetical protein FWB88_07865 [Defluviitaleaceae bacterium]|nr:hypothetical protein [Defluviitaleaceae bacterium]MCL2240112.1 hypothetical protein [Defluviitaleaceae bacterium]
MYMTVIIFIAIFILVTVVVSFVVRTKADRELRRKLADAFGKPPEVGEGGQPECLENLESIARYAGHMEEVEPGAWRLDATTWNDLDMDRIFGRLNICLSSVGEEYLYNCLHELQRGNAPLLERERLVQFLAANPEERLVIQMALAGLGKENYNGLVRLMFNADERFLRFQWLYNALALLPLLGAIFLFVHVPIGFIVLFAGFMVNIVVHNRVKDKLEDDIPAIEYLNHMLRCCKKLCALNISLPAFDAVKGYYGLFKSVVNRLPKRQSNLTLYLDFDFLVDYVRILFLYEVRNYNRLMKKIREHNDEIHGLFKAVGEVETALCVQSFRLSLPVYCTPEFISEARIAFTDLVHPLIATPVANSGAIVNDSLLTGSNASGKSTFIKSLALGGILAQTLNTCAAAHFSTRFSWIMTSMVMRDDLSGGDSYFIVEIKSLRRMLDRVRRHPCVCYIDEILRGTNTVERIAASASVLTWLHGQSCLCVAASHDIELTHLLADSYENYHFREQITPTGVLFDYKLKTGPSTTRNAIKLLDVMEFDPSIVAQAEKMAQEYDVKQRW